MGTYNEEREQLRAIQAVFEKAVENNSIEDLRPYTDPEFSYVSFTDRSFGDFDSFCRQWGLTREEMVGSGSFTTQLDPEPTLFFDDIAVCYGNSKNKLINKKGAKFDFTSHWTVIFKREDGEWKVLRAHNSMNPFSNPMLIHAVKSKLTLSSLAAFVVGGVTCLLLVYLILT
ncbi:MAG: nuclear transport factor 2 family protein [Gammaproteobacteria bacterium]|nr:nuclear transport factor 2 family protein [Gammaproteobacteria bacterium]